MVVPSHPPLPADKVTLRRLAREGRRDFVASLGEGEQQLLELRLSEVLTEPIDLSELRAPSEREVKLALGSDHDHDAGRRRHHRRQGVGSGLDRRAGGVG